MMQALNKEIFFKAFFEWKINDLPLIKFIAQGTIAALLALYLCLYFNLNMPQTSVFTVFLVMQVYSGMVYSKSFYRLIGSLVGTIVAIILATFFAQDRISFTLFFALWIGLCGSIGYMSRNFMSYGFVLSAYTIALVVMPTVGDFSNIFLFGIDRLSEVIIGLLCSSLVSDVFFPKKISSSLILIENQKYSSFLNLLKDSDTIFELKKNNIDFNSAILGTNALKVNTQFEAGMNRNKKLLFRRLNSKYMHLSTTLYSIKKIIHFNKDNDLFITCTKDIYDILKECLIEFDEKTSLKDTKSLIEKVKAKKSQIQIKVEETKDLLKENDLKSLDDYESFIKLFFRLINELIAYLNAHINFIENKKRKRVYQYRKISKKLKFSTYDDKIFLSIVTIRNVATLFIVMTFWILSGWTLGIFSVIPAIAATLLLSTIPNTNLAIKGIFIGLVLGLLITLFFNFYVLPKYVNDYVTLCLVLTPVFIFISYLLYTPKRGIIGLGFIAIFINACLINTSYNMIFENTLDIIIATFIGLFITSVSFTVIKGGSNLWVERRVKKLLFYGLNKYLYNKKNVSRIRLESIGFDLIQRYSIVGKLNDKSIDNISSSILNFIEIIKSINSIKKRLIHIDQNKEINTIFNLLLDYYNLKKEENTIDQIKYQIYKFKAIGFENHSKIVANEIVDNLQIIYSILKIDSLEKGNR